MNGLLSVPKRIILFLFVSCISVFMILGCGNEPNQKGTSSEKSDLKQADVKKNDLPQLPRINEKETIFIYDRIEKALNICGEPSKKMVFNSKNLFNLHNLQYNQKKVIENPDTVNYEFARKGIWITTDINGTIKKVGWMDEVSPNSYPIVKFGGRRLKDNKEMVAITSDFSVDQVIQVYGNPLRRAYSGPLRNSDHPDGVGGDVFLVFNNTQLLFKGGKLAMVWSSSAYYQIDKSGVGIRKAPSSNSPVIRELKLNEIAYETGYIHDTEFHEIVLENGEGPFYVKRGLLKNAKQRNFDTVWSNTKNFNSNENLNNSISKTQSNKQSTVQNLDSTSEKFESYEGKRVSGSITGTDVNLREKPTTNSKVLGVLNNNEPVHILGKQGDWFWIRRIEPNQRGWVYGKYLN